MMMTFFSFILTFVLVAPDTGTPMQNFLPVAVDGWTMSEPSRLFVGREIFTYMDGAGEVYLAYKFDRLLVQRYACPNQEEILLEIFDMETARNAFGISTYMRGRGRPPRIGQDGEYKSGLLSFWRGRYYVCVRVAKENAPATAAVLRLGRHVAKAIGVDGERPSLLKCLPAGRYRSESLRYFYRDEILSTHFTLPEGNLLQLTDSTEGLLVRMKGDRSSLLVIAYPEARAAVAASMKFVEQPAFAGASGGISKTDKGRWSACIPEGRFIILVFDGLSKKRVQDIIISVKRRLP